MLSPLVTLKKRYIHPSLIFFSLGSLKQSVNIDFNGQFLQIGAFIVWRGVKRCTAHSYSGEQTLQSFKMNLLNLVLQSMSNSTKML